MPKTPVNTTLFVYLFLSSGSSCGELVDGTTGISPSGSVTSMPSCLPFPWFGERGKGKEGDNERGAGQLLSVSSNSLPYLTTRGRRDLVRKVCSHVT